MNREQLMTAWQSFEGLWTVLRDDYWANLETLPREDRHGAVAGWMFIERRIRMSRREEVPADTARLE
jgi:hypothetical protein